MKTSYSEIVNENYIGKTENPIPMNEILKKANEEKLEPSSSSLEKVLFLGIDVQQDFMDNGALGVPGAHEDVARMTKFIYNNMEKITHISVSIDTHIPHQIFHPCWWIDENGNNPAPYTVITLADLDSGKWRPIVEPIKSREYVENLEKNSKKKLCIWTYHCLQGTEGAALENQFVNMIYFHSVARKYALNPIVKGQDPLSEMYGIIKPEYDRRGYVNQALLNKFAKFDKIIIGGEARDYCVYESLCQMLEFYKDDTDMLKKFYILEDCMSAIGDKAEVDEIEMQNTAVDDIDSENVNLIFIGIDKSGSMSPYRGDMVSCLKEFKQALTDSKEADEILVARADFNSSINVGGYKKITEFDTSYDASGMTALYNVIEDGTQKLTDYMEYLRQQGVRVKAVFAIFSDGEDTVSNDPSEAKRRIQDLNNKEITTAFISFGGTATGIAKSLGFRNILDVSSSASELRKAFDCLSKSVIESSKSVVADGDNFFI